MDKKKSTVKEKKNPKKGKSVSTKKKVSSPKKDDLLEEEFVPKKQNFVIFFASVAVILVGVIVCVFIPKLFLEKEEIDDMDEFEIKEIKYVDKEIETTDTRFYSLYQVLDDYTYLKSRDEGSSNFSKQELTEISFSGIQKEDFIKLEKEDAYGNAIYQFSVSKLLSRLESYFGAKVSLSAKDYEGKQYLVDVNMPEGAGMSVSNCDEKTNTCEAIFSGVGWTDLAAPHMTKRKIVAAKTREDSEIFVKEKVIYVERDKNDPYTFHIYSDPKHKNLIETKCYTESEVSREEINVEDYIDSAGTIFYNFIKKSDGTYYFYSSDIQ